MSEALTAGIPDEGTFLWVPLLTFYMLACFVAFPNVLVSSVSFR